MKKLYMKLLDIKKLRPLFIAIQFLTRVPVPAMENITDKEVGRSTLYYPVVGLLIGLLLFSIAWVGGSASSLLTAALALSGWVVITGALHLDGLADSADAWVGGNGNKERTLEIMKDPCSGPVAVVFVLLVLLLKFSAIESIISSGQLSLLILAPVIARASMPVLLLTTPYVRDIGLGSAMVEYLPSKKAIYGMIFLNAIFALLFGYVGLAIIAISLICFVLIRKLMIKRIGGTTGDTAGAMLELMETGVLVAIALY